MLKISKKRLRTHNIEVRVAKADCASSRADDRMETTSDAFGLGSRSKSQEQIHEIEGMHPANYKDPTVKEIAGKMKAKIARRRQIKHDGKQGKAIAKSMNELASSGDQP